MAYIKQRSAARKTRVSAKSVSDQYLAEQAWRRKACMTAAMALEKAARIRLWA
jgi:hypothetical protein